MGKENLTNSGTQGPKKVTLKRDARVLNLSKKSNEQLDYFYGQSRPLAVNWLEETRSANSDLSPAEFLEVMDEDLYEFANTSKDVDALCNKLTLYVCVSTEIHGGASLDTETRRKAMKIIVNSRRLNKARKIYNRVESVARILAALAELAPNKGKFKHVRKVGKQVNKVLDAKDELNYQIESVFDKKAGRPSLMVTLTNQVISQVEKTLGDRPQSWPLELESGE